MKNKIINKYNIYDIIRYFESKVTSCNENRKKLLGWKKYLLMREILNET